MTSLDDSSYSKITQEGQHLCHGTRQNPHFYKRHRHLNLDIFMPSEFYDSSSNIGIVLTLMAFDAVIFPCATKVIFVECAAR